jgi:hypothetical protein
MEKVCLVIDDNDQQAVLEQLQEKARKRGIALKCLQFNVGSSKRKDLLTEEETINMPAVVEAFKREFAGTKIDLVCIDYLLDDENVTGLDVLKAIHNQRKSSKFMLYSSNLDEVARGIIDDYDGKDGSKQRLINRIKTLTRYNIADFAPRDRYDEVILDIINRNEPSLELVLEGKLLEHGDMIFPGSYPVFEGRSFLEIAHEIRKGTYHGQAFKEEIIEQVIAYMLQISN